MQAKLIAQGWREIEDTGFVGLVGPFFFREADGGKLQFCFPTQSKHANRNGLCQGGALFTFADRALGMATRAATGDKRAATLQLDIHYLDSVRLGDIVEVVPEVKRATKYVVFLGGELKVGERTVATVAGMWKRLANPGTAQ